MSKSIILCVDDDPQVLNALKQQLASGLKGDFYFELAESGEEGLELLQELLDDGDIVPVVISDQLMPGMKGDEFLVKVNAINPRINKILLTGQASANAVGNALNQANLYRYIQKPWDAQDLLNTVKEAAKSYFMDIQLEQQVKLQADVIRYGQLMQQNLNLAVWLETLLQHLGQETHATRACIAVYKPGQDTPIAVSDVVCEDAGQVHYRNLAYEHWMREYPVKVISEVMLNGKALVLDTALADPNWAHDPAVKERKVKSVFAMPIINQQIKLGIMYLEHRFKARFFNGPIADLLQAIAVNMGFSLENIQLYLDMEQKVSNRTSEIREDHTDTKESIRYAARIQRSIMPKVDLLHSVFPQNFVFYQPKAIVSGDFYWFTQQDDLFFVAAADCTGHGVPGAFMSMLGVNLLNQAIREQKILEVDSVLEFLHNGIVEMLRHEEQDSPLRDGMDIALLRFDNQKRQISFAGANRPCFLVRQGELIKTPGSKASIGGQETDATGVFKKQTLEVVGGDAIYLFTDGFVDQFGEDNRKKFSQKRFEELLLSTQKLPIEKQATLMENRLNLWRGDTPQTDDVLVLGFKIQEN